MKYGLKIGRGSHSSRAERALTVMLATLTAIKVVSITLWIHCTLISHSELRFGGSRSPPEIIDPVLATSSSWPVYAWQKLED